HARTSTVTQASFGCVSRVRAPWRSGRRSPTRMRTGSPKSHLLAGIPRSIHGVSTGAGSGLARPSGMTRWWWEATLLAVLSGCGTLRSDSAPAPAPSPVAALALHTPEPDLADAEHQWTIEWITRLCAEDAASS